MHTIASLVGFLVYLCLLAYSYLCFLSLPTNSLSLEGGFFFVLFGGVFFNKSHLSHTCPFHNTR